VSVSLRGGAIAVVAAAISAALLASPAQAANPCTKAEALFAAHEYAEAAKAYQELIVSEKSTAVKEGDQEVCTKQQVRNGLLKAARYSGVPLRATEQLAQAKRLQHAGFEADAREVVKSVAKSSTQPIPHELRAPEQRTGGWRDELGVFGPPLRVILEALALVVIALFAAVVLWGLCKRLKATARLTGFEGSTEATLSAVLSAALSATLTRLSDEKPDLRIAWQSGTEEKLTIPASVTEAVPQANLLQGLLQTLENLLPRRLYSISGTVHPIHPHRGAGITLAIAKRNGNPLDQVTIWEKDFLLKDVGTGAEPAVRYERLILPAAIWLGYHKKLKRKIGEPPLKDPPLGTHDWRSYALFALGEINPSEAGQRCLYELALDRDPGNLGARLNLAACLLQRPSYEVPPPSEQELVEEGTLEGWEGRKQAADVHLRRVACNANAASEPIWYRARYMQAVLSIYRGEGRQARTQLDQMEEMAGIYGEKEALRGLLLALEQPIEILRQSSHVIEAQPGATVGEPPEPKCGWRTAAAEYDLACFWSRYAGIAGNDDAKREERTAIAIRSLHSAIGREPGAREEALVDPAFDPIRTTPGFAAVTKAPANPTSAAEPQQYAVTLDPGPVLAGLVGR
jgi:hypothetical protein